MSDFENCTLLKLLKKCIFIMKIQGLFLHRIIPQSQINCWQEKDLKDEENAVRFKEYLIKHDVKKLTSTQKIHLCYCVAVLIIKYASLIFLFLYFYYISDETTKFIKEGIKNNEEYNYFKYALIHSNFVFFFLFFFSMPIYFILIQASNNGMYKSISSFEFINEKIEESFREYNSQYAYMKPLSYSYKKTIFNILYFLFSFILISFIFIISIYNISTNLNYNTLERVFVYVQCIFLVLVLVDWATILYFISANLVLIQNQVDAFCQYLIALFQKNIQDQNNIESLRSFYDDLYEHVKCFDQWLCYYFGIIYLFSIPFICIFIYTLFIDSIGSDLALLFLSPLLIFTSTLSLITILAVRINAGVRKLGIMNLL